MINITNTFGFTRKISNLFNRRKKVVIYSDPLLWVENGLLQFDDSVCVIKYLKKALEKILENNNVYDDRLFISIFEKYKEHYYMYDHYPYLLVIDSIKVAQKQGLVISDEVYFDTLGIDTNPESKRYYVPKLFRLPQAVERDLLTIWERTLPYRKEISKEQYLKLIYMEYLSLWEHIYNRYKKTRDTKDLVGVLHAYLVLQQEFLVSLASDDNKNTVRNIIDRYWENCPNSTINT